MLISSHRSHSFGNKGFTLIELIVVISIMLVITSVFLFRQQQFNSSTLLRSLGYSVALSIRQAQVYGTSLLEFGGTFDAKSYGVNFNRNTPTTYVLFADTGSIPNGTYDGAAELVDTFNLGQGFTISKFCGILAVGGEVCSPSIDYLNIYFIRPDLDANFRSSNLAHTYTSAYIQVTAPGGATRNVTVSNTGRIAVCAFGTGAAC